MPSKSKTQQRLFGQAWAVRSGKLSREDAWPSAIKIADSDMTDKAIKDFAETSHDNLPEKKRRRKRAVKEAVMTFESFRAIYESKNFNANSVVRELVALEVDLETAEKVAKHISKYWNRIYQDGGFDKDTFWVKEVNDLFNVDADLLYHAIVDTGIIDE